MTITALIEARQRLCKPLVPPQDFDIQAHHEDDELFE